MAYSNISYENIKTLYDSLKINGHSISYDEVTNRNFGIKDYTTASNYSLSYSEQNEENKKD